MSFVHQEDDIVTFINYLTIIQITELKDSGNQNLSLMDLFLQFLFG